MDKGLKTLLTQICEHVRRTEVGTEWGVSITQSLPTIGSIKVSPFVPKGTVIMTPMGGMVPAPSKSYGNVDITFGDYAKQQNAHRRNLQILCAHILDKEDLTVAALRLKGDTE